MISGLQPSLINTTQSGSMMGSVHPHTAGYHQAPSPAVPAATAPLGQAHCEFEAKLPQTSGQASKNVVVRQEAERIPHQLDSAMVEDDA